MPGRDLRYADLFRSIFVRNDFRDANLHGAFLWGANLEGAVLRGANLQGANLVDADLQGADLRGAWLWRALLDEEEDLNDRWVLADLRGAGIEPMEEADEPGATKASSTAWCGRSNMRTRERTYVEGSGKR